MDLSGFDNEKIGEAIANCPIPVITGIGHEIDQSVADVVSHTSLKTPTAVADFLIELLLDFEGVLDTTFDRIAGSIQMTVTDQRNRLKQAAAFLSYAPRQIISSQRAFLEMATPQMRQAASSRLRNATTFLKHAEDIMHAVEPTNVLKRGFSITKINGKLLRDVEDLAKGDEIETQLTDHTITSTVKEWHQKK
jgi:exodeoxyribonuclease VII large subunit